MGIQQILTKNEVARNYIVTSDGEVLALSEIKNIFMTTCDDVLNDKAKIFYIDACRGQNAVPKDQIKQICRGSKANKFVNNLTECYTHYSTTGDYFAYESGSGGYLISAIYDYYSKQFKQY